MLSLKQKVKFIIAFENIKDATLIQDLNMSSENFYKILREPNIPVGERGKDFIKILNEKSKKLAKSLKPEDLTIISFSFIFKEELPPAP